MLLNAWNVPILGELPLLEGVSTTSDGGYPFMLSSAGVVKEAHGWRDNIFHVTERVASALWNKPIGIHDGSSLSSPEI